MDLKLAKLWPSLAHIRSEFYPDVRAQMLSDGGRAGASPASKANPEHRLDLLMDLQRRRQAAANQKFSFEWAPGKLVLIKALGSARPVLLTSLAGPDLWNGLLVAPECDWASAFDVLLEPKDEPFDPLCGMVQCWNSVTIKKASHHEAQVLGQLSADRLTTMITTAYEAKHLLDCGEPAQPGFIALRSLTNGTTVLTGSALDEHDIRHDFQVLYLLIARAISA
jgi:hypothetical protein